MVVSLIVLALVIALDQLTKFFIFGTETISIIGDFLWFQSEKNTGAAFSILAGNNWFFIIFTLITCIVIFYLLLSKKWFVFRLEKIALALILGGAISNLIDRIVFAYVRDFIYLKFINFAIFNVADMAITIGAILLICAILFLQKKKPEEENK